MPRAIRLLPLLLPLLLFPLLTPAGASLAADAVDAAGAGEQRQVPPEELFAALSKAAAEGQASAMYDLGLLYERGLGTGRNLSLALEWFRKAAATGNLPEAWQKLGLAYEQGLGTEADQKKAYDNFRRAADLKLAEAFYRLALRALTLSSGPPTQNAEQKALDALTASGLTPAQAQEALGAFYEQGLAGSAPNFTKALEWYEKAAEAGVPRAWFRAGVSYELGLGAPVDPQAAALRFQSAADHKIPEAAYKLAALAQAGGDSKKAVEYLKKAADEGYAPAANELGVIYLEGRLEQKVNPEQALAMFTKSAELGNPEAMKNVAVIYRDGLGGRKADPLQALKWYLIAGKSGYQPQNLAPIIADLEKGLSETQVRQGETEAETWLADFAPKRQPAPGP